MRNLLSLELVFPYKKSIISSWLLLRFFSSSLIFGSLLIMYIGVNFFYHYLGCAQLFVSASLYFVLFFTIFEKFLAIISLKNFQPTFFLLF